MSALSFNPGYSNYTSNFNTATSGATNAATSSASIPSQIEALEAKYPNLEADIATARADVARTQNSDKWSGLKWYEKAIFFIPPFGPLLGVSVMQQNKQMAKDAVSTLDDLLIVAAKRNALYNALGSDRFEA